MHGSGPGVASNTILPLHEVLRIGRPNTTNPDSDFHVSVWVFPKVGVTQNGWFIMENPIKMDDLGVPLFSETSVWKTRQLGSTCFVLSKFKYSQALNIEIKPSFGPGGFPVCNVKLPALGRCNQKFSRVG